MRSLLILVLAALALSSAVSNAAETVALLIAGDREPSRAAVESAEKQIHALLDESGNPSVKVVAKLVPLSTPESGWREAIAELERLPSLRVIAALDPLSGQELHENAAKKREILAPFGVPQAMSMIEEDLKAFEALAPLPSLTLLADPEMIARLRGFKEAVAELGADLGVPVRLDSKPADAGAVYVSAFYSGADARLMSDLLENKVRVYSGQGTRLVEQGALAGMSDAAFDLREMRRARAVALGVQALLSGETPVAEQISLADTRRLAVNLATARKLGLSPRLEVLRDALVVGAEGPRGAKPDSLRDTVLEALQANPEIPGSQAEAEASEEEKSVARSELLPKVDLGLSALRLDSDLNQASSGLIPEHDVTGYVRARQLLFSEQALADLAVKGHGASASARHADGARLEIARAAIDAHLAALQARQQLRLRQEDADRTRANLATAQARKAAGAATSSDVLRWESQLAQAQKALFDAQMQARSAEVAYNRVLHRPLGDPALLADAGLGDPDLWISDEKFRKSFETVDSFARLEAFLVGRSLESSPEIRALDEQVAAAERGLFSRKARFVLPDVFAEGLLTHTFASDAPNPGAHVLVPGLPIPLTAPALGPTQWAVSLNASYNLFSGGADLAREREAGQRLRALESKRESAREQVEQSLRQALLRSRAAYVAIELERRSADAAARSYDLVRRSYVQGARSITDLIDAQNSAFAAGVASASAVYGFLRAYFDVLREYGTYDILQSETERKEAIARLIAVGEQR